MCNAADDAGSNSILFHMGRVARIRGSFFAMSDPTGRGRVYREDGRAGPSSRQQSGHQEDEQHPRRGRQAHHGRVVLARLPQQIRCADVEEEAAEEREQPRQAPCGNATRSVLAAPRTGAAISTSSHATQRWTGLPWASTTVTMFSPSLKSCATIARATTAPTLGLA